MRAGCTRVQRRIEARIVEGVSTAVEEAEVVASAGEGRGSGGQASRENDEVGEHGENSSCAVRSNSSGTDRVNSRSSMRQNNRTKNQIGCERR